MRIARHFDPQSVDRGVRAAQHRPQVGPAEGKIDRLLGPSDDADALAIGGHHPDAAWPGAINPADAVDLQAVRYARLRAFVQVGEDAALHHEPEPFDPVSGTWQRRLEIEERRHGRHGASRSLKWSGS
jgi:hypothetical protein